MAWIGRFHGAMDRPPHPTGQELADALGDLMTQPRDDWKPALFRRYVERIRRDATRDAERAAARPDGVRALSTPANDRTDAANVVAQIRDLVTDINLPGQGSRRVLRAASVAELGGAIAAAFKTVGGVQRFLALDAKPGDLTYLIRDFDDALRAAHRAPEKISA
jgi:hypothetical protein